MGIILDRNMNKELKKLINCDIDAFKNIALLYGAKQLSIIIKITFLRNRYYPNLSTIVYYRNARYHLLNNNRLRYFYYTLRLRRYRVKTGIDLSPQTDIGSPFLFEHLGPRVISPLAIIGKNCKIFPGVTIGGGKSRNKEEGFPVIGDNVSIRTNSVVAGKIKIGNNVNIGPNCFINFDIPDSATVISTGIIVKEKKYANL